VRYEEQQEEIARLTARIAELARLNAQQAQVAMEKNSRIAEGDLAFALLMDENQRLREAVSELGYAAHTNQERSDIARAALKGGGGSASLRSDSGDDSASGKERRSEVSSDSQPTSTCPVCGGQGQRLREALERIAAMGVAADAKGSQSKRVMTIARAALTPTEEPTDE
jgi:hypothetical protein